MEAMRKMFLPFTLFAILASFKPKAVCSHGSSLVETEPAKENDANTFAQSGCSEYELHLLSDIPGCLSGSDCKTTGYSRIPWEFVKKMKNFDLSL